MDPLTIAILAGTGLLKSELIDRPKETRQRKLRAEEIRFSPWTKMAPTTQVQEADPFGSAMQYGMTGAALSQGASAQQAAAAQQASQNELMAAQTKYLGAQTPPSMLPQNSYSSAEYFKGNPFAEGSWTPIRKNQGYSPF